MATNLGSATFNMPPTRGFSKKVKKGVNPYGDRLNEPMDQFMPLAYSELQLIQDHLTKIEAPQPLIDRVSQQIQRSDAVLHSMEALDHLEFIARFFTMGNICVFCHAEIEEAKDVKIHIARKHYTEVAFGPESESENLRRKLRPSGSWYMPSRINFQMWRDGEFAEDWGVPPEQTFIGQMALLEEGEVPWPDGHGMFPVQEMGGMGEYGYLQYDPSNHVWTNHRNEPYNRCSIEVEIH
jgi:hypothetical protein